MPVIIPIIVAIVIAIVAGFIIADIVRVRRSESDWRKIAEAARQANAKPTATSGVSWRHGR